MIARAGGLLAIAMAYRLGSRLGGRAAGVIAGGSLLLADEFVRNFARGNSEGLLVGVCLWAIERHLDGRRTDAFLLGFAAALLRPEVWPFFGLYGLWLAWTDPRRRALVLGVFALNGFLWFAPEYWGSGDWLRAANRAHQPNPDSAAFADRPFIEVFRRSAPILSVPVLLGAVVAVVVAVRERRAELLALAAAAVVLMVDGRPDDGGRLRGQPALRRAAGGAPVRARGRRLGRARARGARALRPYAGRRAGRRARAPSPRRSWSPTSGRCATARAACARRRDFYGTLPDAIAKAGGADAGQALRPGLHGQLPGPGRRLGAARCTAATWGSRPKPPGIIVAARYHEFSRDERFKLQTETTKWVVRRACER